MQTDILIVGTGCSGLYAALQMDPKKDLDDHKIRCRKQ